MPKTNPNNLAQAPSPRRTRSGIRLDNGEASENHQISNSSVGIPAGSQHERPGMRRALREINIRPLSYPNRDNDNNDNPADQSVLIIESDVDNNSPAPSPPSQAPSGANNISVIDLTDTGEYIAGDPKFSKVDILFNLFIN